MVNLEWELQPILDSLAAKGWRGTRGDEVGQFLFQSSEFPPGTSAESMHECLVAMYKHARRWAPGLEVPFFVPPVRIEALHVAGTFRVEEGYATIRVTIEHVRDTAAILGTLAHEACHDILRQSGLSHKDNVNLDEITTDLAMYICGFGELALHGHTHVPGYGGAGARVHLGYLTSEQHQRAHDYVLAKRVAAGLPGRVDLAALVVREPVPAPSRKEEWVNGTGHLVCGDAMCKRIFRVTLLRQGAPWPVQCPACGVFLYPGDVLERADANELEPHRAEVRLPSDGGLVRCTSDALRALAGPIEVGAPPPPDVAVLLADMLDAALLSRDTPAHVKVAEPPVPSQRSAPRLPSQGRAARAPSRRHEPPSGAARKGMVQEFEWKQLDEKTARRRGLPPWIPVPRGQSGEIAREGLDVVVCRTWVNDFLLSSEAGKSGAWRKKNAAMVSSLEAFVDKGLLWDKAHKAFAESDHERAITTLKRIVSMDPDDHAARLDLAAALAAGDDHPGALKALKAIKKTFDGDPDYHVDLGRAHLALHDRDSALNEMANALEAKPDCRAAFDAMTELGILAVAEYLSGRRAQTAARAEERARAEADARAVEKARTIAASRAEEKARLDALATIKRAMGHTDTLPRSPDGFEPPKTVPGRLNTARLPELSDGQRQQIIKRGQKALAEEAAKAVDKVRAEGPVPGRALGGAAVDMLLALVNLEPERAARENVLTGSKEKDAGMPERALAKPAAETEKVFPGAAAETESVPNMQQKALDVAGARAEKATSDAAAETELVARMRKRTLADRAEADVTRLQESIRADRAEPAEVEQALGAKAEEKAINEGSTEAEENARDEVAASTKELGRHDALAKTTAKVARADEMALDETAAKAKARERARGVRQAVLLVAALILAVVSAILGKRMLPP